MAAGHRDLIVYRRAYQLAMEVFRVSSRFPRSELYSLTDQVRRSSRSVAANIAEGFRKRRYPRLLAHRITDADAEVAETLVWLDFAEDCGYLEPVARKQLTESYEEIGKMLGAILRNPSKY